MLADGEHREHLDHFNPISAGQADLHGDGPPERIPGAPLVKLRTTDIDGDGWNTH